MKPRVIEFSEQAAADAFAAHAALIRAERDNPGLSKNPAWTMLRQDAYERFALAFREVR